MQSGRLRSYHCAALYRYWSGACAWNPKYAWYLGWPLCFIIGAPQSEEHYWTVHKKESVVIWTEFERRDGVKQRSFRFARYHARKVFGPISSKWYALVIKADLNKSSTRFRETKDRYLEAETDVALVLMYLVLIGTLVRWAPWHILPDVSEHSWPVIKLANVVLIWDVPYLSALAKFYKKYVISFAMHSGAKIHMFPSS